MGLRGTMAYRGQRAAKKPKGPELCANDSALNTVCLWLGVNPERFKAQEGDYSVKEDLRPEHGGLGSECLTKAAVKNQTDGFVAFGDLGRKLLGKRKAEDGAEDAAERAKRAREELAADDDVDKAEAVSKKSKVLDARSGVCLF